MALCDPSAAVCDSNAKWNGELISVEFVKYCISGPSRFGFWGVTWMLFWIFSIVGCFFGCFYKYKYDGSRGLEMVPCIDALRACYEACREQYAKRAGGGSGSMSINSAAESAPKSVALPKYQQISQKNAALEAGQMDPEEPYEEEDEDFDFSIEDFGAPGRKGGTAGASYQSGAPPTDETGKLTASSPGSYGSM